MGPLRRFLTGIVALFRGRRLNQELDEELRSYLDSAVEAKMRSGMSHVDALRSARTEMGSQDAVKQKVWSLGWESGIENLWRDLSFSARLLRKSPGFTAVAVLTLALGVGANTAVFSLIDALLLRPLPVPHAEELTVIRYERSDVDMPNYGFCAPLFRALEKRHDVFRDVAAFFGTTLQVRNSSGNQNIHGAFVSGQFFDAMQTRPLLGRYLTQQDDREGGAAAGLGVVISEAFWRTWFNGAPDVVGNRLIISNTTFTVVGVMPKQFIGAESTERPEIYVPLWAEPAVDAPYNMTAGGYHSWWMRIIARRNPAVTPQRADSALQAASNSILDEAIPDAEWIKEARSHHFRFTAEAGSTGHSFLAENFRKPLLAVFALCTLMLLLACLNLASLLMARAAARERELATRLAIGATRRRLMQQFLVESFLIAVLGTGVGLAIAPLVSRSLVVLLFAHIHDVYGATIDTGIDLRVLAFVALTVTVSVLSIGLLPAVRITSGNLNDHIKDSTHATSARERRRLLPRILMGLEVGLALILVTGAGLLATSLSRLYRAGLGFDPKGVVNVELSMDKQSLGGDALIRWYRAFGDAIRHQPGVKAVSFDNVTPLSGSTWTSGYETTLSGGVREIYMNRAAPGYFRTMRIPLLAGRDFRWDESVGSGRKIILNQSAAQVLFPGQNALGQLTKDPEGKQTYEVVGIVGDVRYRSIRKEDPPGAYTAVTQNEVDPKPSYTAVVRLDGPVAPFAAAVRRLTTEMAPDIPAPVLTTMSSELDSSISSERMMAMLSVFFAGCALLVTAIGLYGTLSYATARRTSEVGIRMALGAQRLQVVVLIFRENAWIAAGGAAAGLLAALLTLRALASFLYGISAHDPWVMGISVLLLEVVASAASLIPAIRAARIEPITAIRCE